MSTPEIKRLANSHLESLTDTIEALKAQGAQLKMTRTTNDCSFVTGVVCGQHINDVFYVDNEASILRLASFNRRIRSFIKVPSSNKTSNLGAA